MNTRDLQAVLRNGEELGILGEWVAAQLVADHALAEEMVKPPHERDDDTVAKLLAECHVARGPGPW